MIANADKNALLLCMQCGTCSASCVAKTSFNLRRLVFDSFLKNDLLSSQNLWDCTTCHNCQSRCPRGIPLTDLIVESRKGFVESGVLPTEIRDYLTSIQKFKNPFGQSKQKRVEWAKDLDLKVVEEDEFEWLWWVGCMVYDPRTAEVARKTARILESIGLNFAILGKEEGCCGNDVLSMGEEGLFELLKEENESIFEKYGVKKLVVSSPHCYNTFKNHYDFAGLEVVSILELVYDAIRKGTLEFKYDVEASVTYHDPCYLGRYNGMYDLPREVLKSIYNIEFVEMRRIRENSFCCGGGSGNFLRENRSRSNVSRAREAVSTNADILAVACPICLNMLEDGVKTINAEIEVMDIMEIIHLAMFGE
ncbi:MAG: (Fe-S)-binding protein [Archaeoglobus sp.]|nr:(Fe-S)-binding protein [Archaeoglobus sp.]